jgi:hypothetical protein
MNCRPRVSLFIAIFLLLTPPIAAAAMDYTITSTPSIDTPDRTVQIEDSEYTVSSIGRAAPGSDFRIETTGPSGASYDVYLYDGDRNIMDTRSAEGDDSIQFSTEYLESGSYMAAIYGPDGTIRAIQPVVISGYQVEVSDLETITENEGFDVSVSLQKRSERARIDEVEVVVVQDGVLVERTTATKATDAYTATVSPLESGQYAVYAVVRNQSTVRGKHELIGISDLTSFRVATDADQQSPTSTESESVDGGGSGPDSAVTETQRSTHSDTATATLTTRTTTDRETGTTRDERATTETTDARSTLVTSGKTTTPDSRTTTTENSFLTPGASTPTTTATQTDGPWLSSLLIVLAAAALFARRE